MKKHTYQAGFAPLLILLGIVILGGIGVAAVKNGAIQKKSATQHVQQKATSTINPQPQSGSGNQNTRHQPQAYFSS